MCLLDIIFRPVQVWLNFKYRSLCNGKTQKRKEKRLHKMGRAFDEGQVEEKRNICKQNKYNVSQKARGTARKDKNQSSKMQNEKEDSKYWAEWDSN